MFEKQVVIDGKGHMLGRLASVVAKELLSGQKIVVVRCEQIVMSGSCKFQRWLQALSDGSSGLGLRSSFFVVVALAATRSLLAPLLTAPLFCLFSSLAVATVLRNKDKWARYRKKRHNTNPVRGPYHFRAPSKMFFRVVKGMIPAKTFRGKQALARLATFEGVPDDFGKVKRMVVPDALQVLVSKTYRKTTVLGTLASEVGWKHGELIKKLETARIASNAEYYAKKKETAKANAAASEACTAQNAELAKFGYYIEPTAPGAMKAIKEEFASSV